MLRSDYYEPAATDPRLREVLQGSQVVVGPMSEDELRRAVVEPARAAGTTMPDALLEVVVTEARGYRATGHQGLLPHLSTALRATWEAAGQGALSVADYRAAGGITGAIEQTAEAAYAGLDPEAREVLRHLLLRLVNVSHEGPLTRRSATKDELADLTATVPQTDLVEHLTAARLLSVSTDQVELAHESLLTAWPRLTRWIEDARADLEAQAQLRDAATLWDEHGRVVGDVARGSAYDRFSALADRSTVLLTPLERRYLDASRAEGERRAILGRRRVRRRRPLLAAAAARLALSAYRIASTLDARSAVLELGSQNLPQRLVGPPGAKAVAVSPDGGLVAASTTTTDDVTLYTAGESGGFVESATLPVGGETYTLDISPDGRLLAVGTATVGITLWDLTADQPQVVHELEGPAGPRPAGLSRRRRPDLGPGLQRRRRCAGGLRRHGAGPRVRPPRLPPGEHADDARRRPGPSPHLRAGLVRAGVRHRRRQPRHDLGRHRPRRAGRPRGSRSALRQLGERGDLQRGRRRSGRRRL